MINLKLYRPLALIALTVTLFTACRKVDQESPVNSSNQSAVSLTDGGMPGINKIAIDFSTTPVTLLAAEIKRTFANEKDLNNSLSVVIIDDTAAVKAVGLTLLPADLYSLSVAKSGDAGGTYNLAFEARETVKQISITIPDATQLNPGTSYGLGFTIESTGANGVVNLEKTVILHIITKNAFDGRYQLKGYHSRPTLSDVYDEEVHLITTGANSVKMYWPALGTDAHPINGGVTFYSNFTTEFAFNISTNMITGVVNPYNPAATPFTLSNESNRFDPATKTIYARYYYNNNMDRMFTDTLVYIGAR